MKRLSRAWLCAGALAAFTSVLLAQTPVPIPPNVRQALQSIRPSNLKGDLSFLASDTLEGRYTPSPGLDVAAEFIASQFRAAGLQPGGDQEYFQLAHMVDRHMPKVQSGLTLEEGPQTSTVPPQFVAVTNTGTDAKIERAPVLVLKKMDAEALKSLDLTGKAILLAPFRPARGDMQAYLDYRAFQDALSRSGAALVITLNQTSAVETGPPRLIEADEAEQHRVPTVTAKSDQLAKWLENPDDDSVARTVTIEIPAPEDKAVVVKNVIGVLPGSDAGLKNTYVMLTAHYDHIGTTETAGRTAMTARVPSNDHIYNGANDDGSGTVSVIEIARALGGMTARPRRTMVFMTFFGEERGLLGSQYYGRHPRFPVAQTVADLNLEQVGRTDSTEGPQINTASLTGYDYSDVTKYIEAAGRSVDVRVYLDKTASDPYFTRSDNVALALLGVPAETLTVAFEYPDYHGLGDEWKKIDYDNMARVDRMVALGLFDMANNPNAPQWNGENPKTLPFRKAQQKLLGEEPGH